MYSIDPYSTTAIYQQIVEQTREMVYRRILQKGDRVPSIRELAATLGVNPSTIAKAYTELEREGIIATIRGRGTFIAMETLRREEAVRLIREEMIPVMRRGFVMGLTREELKDLSEDSIREVTEHESGN